MSSWSDVYSMFNVLLGFLLFSALQCFLLVVISLRFLFFTGFSWGRKPLFHLGLMPWFVNSSWSLSGITDKHLVLVYLQIVKENYQDVRELGISANFWDIESKLCICARFFLIWAKMSIENKNALPRWYLTWTKWKHIV